MKYLRNKGICMKFDTNVDDMKPNNHQYLQHLVVQSRVFQLLFHFCPNKSSIVVRYHEHPGKYLYARVTALYAHINYAVNNKANEGFPINWSNKALTQFWGRINRFNARDYENQLANVLQSRA